MSEEEIMRNFFKLLNEKLGIIIKEKLIKKVLDIKPKLNVNLITKVLDQYYYLFEKIILFTPSSRNKVYKFVNEALEFYFSEIHTDVKIWLKESYEQFLNIKNKKNVIFVSSNQIYLYYPKQLGCSTIYIAPFYDESPYKKLLLELYMRWYDEINHMWAT